jgi:hypothetical protein
MQQLTPFCSKHLMLHPEPTCSLALPKNLGLGSMPFPTLHCSCRWTTTPSELLWASASGHLSAESMHICKHCGATGDQFATHGLSCQYSEGRHFDHAAINDTMHSQSLVLCTHTISFRAHALAFSVLMASLQMGLLRSLGRVGNNLSGMPPAKTLLHHHTYFPSCS